jgi:heme/copper-type cytochrome/quinol oxidase subunit 2
MICHEYCGPAHHSMHGNVVVLSPEEFEASETDDGEG